MASLPQHKETHERARGASLPQDKETLVRARGARPWRVCPSKTAVTFAALQAMSGRFVWRKAAPERAARDGTAPNVWMCAQTARYSWASCAKQRAQNALFACDLRERAIHSRVAPSDRNRTPTRASFGRVSERVAKASTNLALLPLRPKLPNPHMLDRHPRLLPKLPFKQRHILPRQRHRLLTYVNRRYLNPLNLLANRARDAPRPGSHVQHRGARGDGRDDVFHWGANHMCE